MDGINKVGRPLKFKTVQELEEKINEYFVVTPIEEQTVTGLALHLDTTRELLCDYDKRDEFSDTIKRCKLRIEYAYEKRGMEKGTAFDIFRLKNMGWKDRHDTDITSKGERIAIDISEKIANKHTLHDTPHESE